MDALKQGDRSSPFVALSNPFRPTERTVCARVGGGGNGGPIWEYYG